MKVAIFHHGEAFEKFQTSSQLKTLAAFLGVELSSLAATIYFTSNSSAAAYNLSDYKLHLEAEKQVKEVLRDQKPEICILEANYMRHSQPMLFRNSFFGAFPDIYFITFSATNCANTADEIGASNMVWVEKGTQFTKGVDYYKLRQIVNGSKDHYDGLLTSIPLITRVYYKTTLVLPNNGDEYSM